MIFGEVTLISPIFQNATLIGLAKLFFILPLSGPPTGVNWIIINDIGLNFGSNSSRSGPFQAGITAKLRSVPAENRTNCAFERPRKTFDMAKAETTGLMNRPETGKPRAKKNCAYRARVFCFWNICTTSRPGKQTSFAFALKHKPKVGAWSPPIFQKWGQSSWSKMKNRKNQSASPNLTQPLVEWSQHLRYCF